MTEPQVLSDLRNSLKESPEDFSLELVILLRSAESAGALHEAVMLIHNFHTHILRNIFYFIDELNEVLIRISRVPNWPVNQCRVLLELVCLNGGADSMEIVVGISRRLSYRPKWFDSLSEKLCQRVGHLEDLVGHVDLPRAESPSFGWFD